MLMKRLDKRKSVAHSWIILGQSLALNQACGELLLRLEELDIAFTAQFLERTEPFLGCPAANMKGAAGDKGIQQHDLFLLDNSQGGSSTVITRDKLSKFFKTLKQTQQNVIVNKKHKENFPN